MDQMSSTDFSMTTRRIESLADNVFSVAMTLLVVNLTIPEAARISDVALHQLLMQQSHRFVNYFMSFLLLAILWVAHHQQFHFIHKTNRIHLWINILILMFVVLMPFSTSLIGDYSGVSTAKIFFSANMLILSLLFLINWMYASGKRRLVKSDMSDEAIQRGTWRSTVFVLVSLAALILCFVLPGWSSIPYLFIPMVFSMRSLLRPARGPECEEKTDAL